MRVALCDDQQLFVEALATLLAARGHTVSVDVDHELLADRLREQPVDLCVIDHRFAGSTSLATVRGLRARHPELQVVVLTAHPASPGLSSLRGVRVISKSEQIDVILDLLEAVVDGSAAPAPSRACSRSAARPFSLTDRELAVLVELARGANTKAMVRTLGITAATTRSYVQSVLCKLNAHSRLQAVALAIEAGILSSGIPE